MDKGASMPDLEYSGIISVGAFFLEEWKSCCCSGWRETFFCWTSFFNDDGTSQGEWENGPELPAKIGHSTLIEYKNYVILIGGNLNEDCETKCFNCHRQRDLGLKWVSHS